MKIPYKNLCPFLKKSILLTSLIISFACSDGTNFKNRREQEKGFRFCDNYQSRNFFSNVDFRLTQAFERDTPFLRRDKILTVTSSLCHTPLPKIDDIYLILLVPGFKIRDIDNYSPIVAARLKKTILDKNPNNLVQTAILTRWGSFSYDNKDNETFETQYFILRNQFDQYINELSRYHKKIHVIFIGESYGGKISLFFLDQLLENLDDTNVSIESLITIHSPLYKMDMANWALRSGFVDVFDSITQTLTPTQGLWGLFKVRGGENLSRYQHFVDIFNIKDYRRTYTILNSNTINSTTTDLALQNLSIHNVKVFNFIGTPKNVGFGGTIYNFNIFLKNFSDSISNPLVKFLINTQDPFLNVFNDKEYMENSDFVVKTSEITKNQGLIRRISANRDKLNLYEEDGITYISSPHINHLGDDIDLDAFKKDLFDRQLNACFRGMTRSIEHENL